MNINKEEKIADGIYITHFKKANSPTSADNVDNSSCLHTYELHPLEECIKKE